MDGTQRAELVERAYELHKVVYLLGTSARLTSGDLLQATQDHGNRRDRWSAYDHAQEALVQVLALITGDRDRAQNVRMLMIDDMGEGAEYWLRQEREKYLSEAADMTFL